MYFLNTITARTKFGSSHRTNITNYNQTHIHSHTKKHFGKLFICMLANKMYKTDIMRGEKKVFFISVYILYRWKLVKISFTSALFICIFTRIQILQNEAMKLIYAGNYYKISNGIFFEWMQILHKKDIFSFMPGDIHRYLLKAYTLQTKCSEKKTGKSQIKNEIISKHL